MAKLKKKKKIVLFEPTSVPKSLKLFEFAETTKAQAVKYTSPNQFELEAMCDTIESNPILSKTLKRKKKEITDSILPVKLESMV